VKITDYIIARSLYDRLNYQSDPILLNNEQFVISADEYRADHIIIDAACQLEISGQVKRGQDIELTLMRKGDFEWAMQENEPFDAVFTTTIDHEHESVVIELEQGDYMIHMTPVSSEESSSLVEISARVYTSILGKSRLKNKKSLNNTIGLVLLLLLSFPIYVGSLSSFLGFVNSLGNAHILVSLSLLIFSSAIVSPLSFFLYFDARKTKKVSNFPRDVKIYMIALLIPVFSVLVLVIYLTQRSKVRV